MCEFSKAPGSWSLETKIYLFIIVVRNFEVIISAEHPCPWSKIPCANSIFITTRYSWPGFSARPRRYRRTHDRHVENRQPWWYT